MYSLIDLRGKTIIVIGASQGIGAQTAITLSQVGARCILLARNEEKLKGTLKKLDGEGHGMKALDVSEIDLIEPCINEIITEIGSVDGLVYTAGVTNDRPLRMITPKIVEDTIRINFEGFLETVRALSKRKRFNPGARIVAISSSAGLQGKKAHTIYCASKAAMDGAVRCLAKELAEKGICINTVAPGMIRTSMYEKWLQDNGDESYTVQELMKRQYRGIGETIDVAYAICFLLSPAARFINGICLPVDGGLTSD